MEAPQGGSLPHSQECRPGGTGHRLEGMGPRLEGQSEDMGPKLEGMGLKLVEPPEDLELKLVVMGLKLEDMGLKLVERLEDMGLKLEGMGPPLEVPLAASLADMELKRVLTELRPEESVGDIAVSQGPRPLASELKLEGRLEDSPAKQVGMGLKPAGMGPRPEGPRAGSAVSPAPKPGATEPKQEATEPKLGGMEPKLGVMEPKPEGLAVDMEARLPLKLVVTVAKPGAMAPRPEGMGVPLVALADRPLAPLELMEARPQVTVPRPVGTGASQALMVLLEALLARPEVLPRTITTLLRIRSISMRTVFSKSTIRTTLEPLVCMN